jgi:GntR family transcriptional regulator
VTLPFQVEFRPGDSPYRQVVYAAKRAIVSGRMPPGERFPSVRSLSQALKINPNTAHKVVGSLVAEGLLEVRPGVGTVVAASENGDRRQKSALLKDDVERLVVEAKKLGLNLSDVSQAVESHWARLTSAGERSDS